MLAISGFGSIIYHCHCLATATAKLAQLAREFFTHLFYHPGEHLQFILAIGAVVIAAVVVPVYLAKREYEKRFHR